MAERDKEINDACQNNIGLTQFMVTDLKKYLANRKLNVSGLKSELVERIIGAYKLSITPKHEQNKRDQLEKAKRDTERFILPCGKRIPPPWTLETWLENIKMFPVVAEKDIYNYIVLKMNSKRQLKSKVFYDDGHVQKLEINTVSDEASHCYARASVLPSFPTADKRKSPEYQPWVLLSKVTGCIHSAFCNCPAGEGECCNHIGALLYGLEDLSRKKDLAPTSKPCTWSNFSMLSAPRKRRLSPRKSDDLIFKKKKLFSVSCRKLSVDKDHHLNKENGCTVNIERLRQRLLNAKLNVGWLKNFPPEKVDEPDMPSINSIEFCFHDEVDLISTICQEVFIDHFENMHQSSEDMILTEILTRGQNNNQWQEARKERLTSSNFGSVCRRKTNTPPDGLLKQMLYSSFKRQYTEYGKKHEKVARKMYIKSMQKEHKGLIVKECGLYVSEQKPHLGASPDGLVFCSHCKDSVGVLEIKCPASKIWRMQTPEQCCQDKDFFCHIVNGRVELKESHGYYYQVQGQMGVTGKQWCDFVVWTCVGLSVQRIKFDESLWLSMCFKLDRFYVEAFIPELYSQRVQRGIKLFL